jgi:anthranilate/para-aminobenzoate synthase component II
MPKVPLVLWGGTDIGSEFFYNKPKSKYAQNPDVVRDIKERGLVNLAITKGQPIIGVCRGAQLLCAMNGGTLYQHSEPHKQNHSLDCLIQDGPGQEAVITFKHVAAGHHQVMNPKGNFEILGWNPNSEKMWLDDETIVYVTNSAEVVWYPETKCLAIQPHPEWSTPDDPFVIWLNNLIKDLGIDYEF